MFTFFLISPNENIRKVLGFININEESKIT